MTAIEIYNTAKEAAMEIYMSEAQTDNYNTRAIALGNLNKRLEVAYKAYELAA